MLQAIKAEEKSANVYELYSKRSVNLCSQSYKPTYNANPFVSKLSCRSQTYASLKKVLIASLISLLSA